MKLLFDLFPVILFFVAFKVAGIYVATGVAIAATIGQVGWVLARGRKVSNMQWMSLVIIVLFGGATLLLKDETFIKWKPTVLHGAFAAALLVSRFVLGRNLIANMMGKQMRLPAPIWERLNWAWIAFFVTMALANLYVAYHFPTEVWVNFKVFGSLGLTLAFVIAQAVWVGRHVQEE